MTGDELQGIAALVTAVGVLAGGAYGTRRAAKHEQEKIETGPVPVQNTLTIPPALEDRLDGDALSTFLHTIVDQYGKQSERLALVEARVTDMQKSEATFRGALGRWLGRVYSAWGHQPQMPMPEGDDMVTLKDVLPH